jgi:lycopene cyclase domain-containing protein
MEQWFAGLRGTSNLYLWLDVLSVAGPLALSFDSKVAFWKSWRYLFPGILVGATVFLIWDAVFTAKGYWTFNSDYLLGVYAVGMPIEEWLFFIVVPYATVFVYECWRCYPTPRMHPKIVQILTALLLVSSVLLSVLFYDRWYTVLTFGGLTAMLLLSYRLFGTRFLGLAYTGWAISLVPFLLVNGILTAIPVVSYNDTENVGVRIGTIPFEDAFYGFLLYLIVLTVMEIRRGTFRTT